MTKSKHDPASSMEASEVVPSPETVHASEDETLLEPLSLLSDMLERNKSFRDVMRDSTLLAHNTFEGDDSSTIPPRSRPPFCPPGWKLKTYPDGSKLCVSPPVSTTASQLYMLLKENQQLLEKRFDVSDLQSDGVWDLHSLTTDMLERNLIFQQAINFTSSRVSDTDTPSPKSSRGVCRVELPTGGKASIDLEALVSLIKLQKILEENKFMVDSMIRQVMELPPQE